MAKIEAVESIICSLIHSSWTKPVRGEEFKVIARHSDGTSHRVGVYTSLEEAETAAEEWKHQYLIEPRITQLELSNRHMGIKSHSFG